MTTDLEALKALVELAKKATPGPWEVCRGFVRTVAGNPEAQPPILKSEGMEVRTSCLWVAECRDGEAFYNPDGNSEFIAAARNSIPALERLLASQGKPEAEGVADPSEIPTLAEMRKLFDVPDAPVAPPSDKLRGLVRKWRADGKKHDELPYAVSQHVGAALITCADELEALLSQEPSSGALVTADVEPAPPVQEAGREPIEPPAGLLVSMAMRMRHDFGFLNASEQEVLLADMRKVFEEVSGAGFYSPDREAEYVSHLAEPASLGAEAAADEIYRRFIEHGVGASTTSIRDLVSSIIRKHAGAIEGKK